MNDRPNRGESNCRSAYLESMLPDRICCYTKRPTHAVIHGLQDEVNHLRQLLQAKQRESQVLESKSGLVGQETDTLKDVGKPSTQPDAFSPYSPIRTLLPTITPKEESMNLPASARPSLMDLGRTSSDRILSVKALQHSPESTRSKVGLQDASGSAAMGQEPLTRVSYRESNILE